MKHNGYLCLAPEEHDIAKLTAPDLPAKGQVVFKFGAQGQGYWINELFIDQVEATIKIAEDTQYISFFV